MHMKYRVRGWRSTNVVQSTQQAGLLSRSDYRIEGKYWMVDEHEQWIERREVNAFVRPC